MTDSIKIMTIPPSDLLKMSKLELVNVCKSHNIKNCGLKKKSELIELIQNVNNENPTPPIQTKIRIKVRVPKKESMPIQEETVPLELNDAKGNDIEIKNTTGLEYLTSISNNSIDLILTDPPYIISKETGMNLHYDKVKQNEKNNVEFIKNTEEWLTYKTEHNIQNDDNKENYMKYGTIYGKKYCVKTDYGLWDSEFTMEMLEQFICEYYKKLKNGGTMIVFFDLWKISLLKDIMEKYNFKQIRLIEWIKTNPQPLNSSVNYLTNCREIALLGVKGSNPTFNSKYDNGIYMFPLQGGKNRFHPTQKSLALFENLITKHSNENDVVLDTFLGGGTTALACKNTNRKFKGCEISSEYFNKVMELM
jgi:site-specific DNA-methyltransferase (adenine-specific)